MSNCDILFHAHSIFIHLTPLHLRFAIFWEYDDPPSLLPLNYEFLCSSTRRPLASLRHALDANSQRVTHPFT